MTGNRNKRAFTLIELLVVIAIIGILIGIALPAFTTARTAAKTASARTFLNTLDQALRNYKMNNYLGSFPPSYWDTQGNDTCPGGSPYEAEHQQAPDGLPADFEAAGAQTLVWALVGADFRGTPGFAGNLEMLYALDDDEPYEPIRRRIPAFVEVTSDNVKALWSTTLARDLLDDSPFDNAGPLPVFVDPFDNPVFYYNWETPQDENGVDNNLGYRYLHNEGLMEVQSDDSDPVAMSADQLQAYVADAGGSNLSGNLRSYNRGDFILMTAGADGLFGNLTVDDDEPPDVTIDGERGDDVTNFLK